MDAIVTVAEEDGEDEEDEEDEGMPARICDQHACASTRPHLECQGRASTWK